MKFCRWLTEVTQESLMVDPALANLVTLAQAGVPIVPGFVVLPEASNAFFGQSGLQAAIDKELRSIGNHAHAAGATRAIHSLIKQAPFPKTLQLDLATALRALVEHTLLNTKAELTIRISAGGVSLDRLVTGSNDLLELIKQLYCAQIDEECLIDGRITVFAMPILVQYLPQGSQQGSVWPSSGAQGDQTIASIEIGNHSGGVHRFDRKSKRLLNEAALRQQLPLTQHELVRLSEMVQRTTELLVETWKIHWIQSGGHIWIDRLSRPAQEVLPYIPTDGMMVGTVLNQGRHTGIVRIIKTERDRLALRSGEIAVVDQLKPEDYRWLHPAGGILTAYGRQHGVSGDLVRRLGIPGVGSIPIVQLDRLKDGQLVTINGRSGSVHTGALERNLPLTPPSTAIKLLRFADAFEDGLRKPHPQGILLSPSTTLLTVHGLHPHEILRRNRSEEYEAIVCEELCAIAKAIYPQPLFYRFHDGFMHPAPRPLDGILPAQRGLQHALRNPEWLRVELRILKRVLQLGASNLIMLTPLLHSFEEVAGLREHTRGEEYAERLWITCGTPAIAIQAEDLVSSSVSGICLDLATLSRLTLGGAPNLGHPAVLQQMQYLLEVTSALGIASMVSAEDAVLPPVALQAAIRAGVDYIVTPQATQSHFQSLVMAGEQSANLEYRLALA